MVVILIMNKVSTCENPVHNYFVFKYVNNKRIKHFYRSHSKMIKIKISVTSILVYKYY